MRFIYSNYSGPGRDHAVIDAVAVPFEARASRRLAENASLLSLGCPEIASRIDTPQQRRDREGARALVPAR
jgi:hypothetical protein